MPRPLFFYESYEISLIQLSLPSFQKDYSPKYIDIYSSFCKQSVVNDAEKQLLNRAFLPEIEAPSCIRFGNPHYVPTNAEQLHVLDIHLLDDEGEKPSFQDGEVYCTLHLRKCQD